MPTCNATATAKLTYSSNLRSVLRSAEYHAITTSTVETASASIATT